MLEFLNWPTIGEGTERVCYRDPRNPHRCIKVSKKKQSKQTRRELEYYRYLEKRQVSYAHIPKFYNKVDEGGYVGLEMEFVCDHDGAVSPNISQYLQQPLSADEVDAFYLALERLKNYLIANNIVPCDLVLSNFLVTRQLSGIKIMMVDGLGGSELFPFSNYISYFGRQKIERKWHKFMAERVIPKVELFHK
ncbi:YrbL family protein [Vibrio diabolicus]|uniref:YrbL family protein n=1 Tax=Vibrio diabolicus TaxID=50719 RepID=UPI00211B3625|nr:YrbL family protein [Vibrio diabolicus]MCG6221664.1 YrbL family protein [Vibrio diabolicus]